MPPEYVMIRDLNHSSLQRQRSSTQQHQRAPLDWSSSSVGLFLGLLSLVTLIISLIIYFALVNQPDFHLVAIVVNSAADSIVNLSMVAAMLVGFFQIRHLHLAGDEQQQQQQDEERLDVVMVTTAFGIFVYCAFTVIAGVLNEGLSEPSEIVIFGGIVELVEVNMQLLFIADLKQRRVHEDRQEEKHGREVVTYMLICNLALWITYNFEIQKVLLSSDNCRCRYSPTV